MDPFDRMSLKLAKRRKCSAEIVQIIIGCGAFATWPQSGSSPLSSSGEMACVPPRTPSRGPIPFRSLHQHLRPSVCAAARARADAHGAQKGIAKAGLFLGPRKYARTPMLVHLRDRDDACCTDVRDTQEARTQPSTARRSQRRVIRGFVDSVSDRYSVVPRPAALGGRQPSLSAAQERGWSRESPAGRSLPA